MSNREEQYAVMLLAGRESDVLIRSIVDAQPDMAHKLCVIALADTAAAATGKRCPDSDCLMKMAALVYFAKMVEERDAAEKKD